MSDEVEDEAVVATASIWVWFGLVLIAAASFWCQAAVTEERFVPALNVIANRFNIPNDVAGATLMAAGASSPELFSSFVALFITHSSLGLGTIVGSEIFNQLIICAGSVFASKTGHLQLDRAILIREVGFYALSIVLLYLALQDARADPADDDNALHIYIGFGDAMMVFIGYIGYVLVCAYMDRIVACCTGQVLVTKRIIGGGGGDVGDGEDAAEEDGITSVVTATTTGGGGSSTTTTTMTTPYYGSMMDDEQDPSSSTTGVVKAVKRVRLDMPVMPYLQEKSILHEPVGNFKQAEFYHTLSGDESRAHQTRRREVIKQMKSDLTGGTSIRSGGGDSGGDGNAATANIHRRAPISRDSVSDGNIRYPCTSGGFIERSIVAFLVRRNQFTSEGTSLRRGSFLMQSERPSDDHAVHDLEVNDYLSSISCFMWQRSYFYNKARFATKGWHLRWFTLSTQERMSSVPDRAEFNRRRVVYPAFTQVEVDEQRMIIRIINPIHGKRDFYLMAPSPEILQAVVKKMTEMIQNNTTQLQQQNQCIVDPIICGNGALSHDSTNGEGAVGAAVAGTDFENGDPHVDLIDFPFGASNVAVFFFVVLFPLRFIMHYTIPDVRRLDEAGDPVGSLGNAFLAIASCLVWLVIGSYAMVASLEDLAALMDIPDAVVGVTVAAAGTSLPNYVASKIAAENGFGNMAVSNAFGSNTFNIMIGLGLPWVLYTSFGTGFQPYHGLKDEGITESVIILGSVLLIFVVLVIPSGFVIYKWHGYLYIVLYIAYLAYEIARVYV